MEPLKILIVDDTIVYRSILRGVVEALPACTVTATASDGKMALERLAAEAADLVLLDVEMPVMGGLETLAAIRERHPDTGVIMVSGVNQNAAAITIKALQQGALEFVPKPESSDPAMSRQMLLDQLGRHVETFRAKRGKASPPVATPGIVRPGAAAPTEPRKRPDVVEVVAIGVSTGGPNALTQVVPRLPADLGVPVVLVQHMPPLFTASLASTLDAQSALTVKEGVEGEELLPNTVYIAPGGKHMILRRESPGTVRVHLNDNPPENNCRPSVDVLFRSVAALYGGHVVTVVMTGMGADGREGTRAVRRQGGLCLTQDEATSVVYGMPRSVVEAGLSDESVPLGQLASKIVSCVRAPGKVGS